MIPLIYFAAGFWFLNVGRDDAMQGVVVGVGQGEKNAATNLFVFTIVFALLLPMMKSIIRVCRDNLVFVSLTALAIASCLWSQLPSKSLDWSLCLAGNTLFAFYLSRRFSSEQQMRLLLLLGWISLVSSIFLALFLPQYGIDHSTDSNNGWMGIYAHKNLCSILTVILLPAAFYVPRLTLRSKMLNGTYVALSVFLVWMTQSATGKVMLVCVFGYSIVMKAVEKYSLKERTVVLLVVAMVALPLIFASIMFSGEITYFLGKDPTLSGRTEIWHAVMVSVMKRPILGYGYQAFWRGIQGESASTELQIGSFMTHAHNGYLEIWLELGAVGLSLFLLSVISAFRNALVCLRSGRSVYIIWYISIVMLVVVMSIDENKGIASSNSLPWILYILSCVGLSDGAKRVRLGQDHG
jgi:O-antigen ligase